LKNRSIRRLKWVLTRLVNLDKKRFVGQSALIAEKDLVARVRLSTGDRLGHKSNVFMKTLACLPPSRLPPRGLRVPVFKDSAQVGKATTSTWSPTLKKMIALATIKREFTKPGTKVQFEITVEAVRHRVGATVVKTPFLQSQA